jgi:hypothetical protein
MVPKSFDAKMKRLYILEEIFQMLQVSSILYFYKILLFGAEFVSNYEMETCFISLSSSLLWNYDNVVIMLSKLTITCEERVLCPTGFKY